MSSTIENPTPDPTASTDLGWVSDVDLGAIADQVGTPVFVYSEQQLRRNVTRILDAARSAGLDHRVELYVPFFPNSNPHVLKALQELGAGVLIQIPAEHEVLASFGFDKFIVSPGHVSDEEIAFWADTGYPAFFSSLAEVEHALELGAKSISARIDSLGSGKPGIKPADLARLAALLDAHGRDLECFEVYCGSGNSREEMIGVIETLFSMFTEHFPTAKSVNFAGGHGFDYAGWDEADKHFDWHGYFASLRRLADRYRVPEHVRFLFEPARDVLADIGVLLLGVKRDIITTPVGDILVTDGTRMLMPSAQLRDRRHNTAFLDADMRLIGTGDAPGGSPAAIRGRTILRHDYLLPGEYLVPDGVGAGCHMLVLDVGAYCATQHMEFLNVPPAAEVLVDADGIPHLVTQRGDALDKWRNLLPEMKQLVG
ncbi:hypothetical protein ACFXGA_11420 [Actinosynnema sp. NPDC059335]|uniref:hypothetical protein n=1 Tax=Actinosynnema sp. NPDC059335 TaxID=3346804 RepID=UPI00366E36D9